MNSVYYMYITFSLYLQFLLLSYFCYYSTFDFNISVKLVGMGVGEVGWKILGKY